MPHATLSWFTRLMNRSRLARLRIEYACYIKQDLHVQIKQSDRLRNMLSQISHFYNRMIPHIPHAGLANDARLGTPVVASDIAMWFATAYARSIPKSQSLQPFIPEAVDRLPLERVVLNDKAMLAYLGVASELMLCYNQIETSPEYMRVHYLNRMYNPVTQTIEAMLTILDLIRPID